MWIGEPAAGDVDRRDDLEGHPGTLPAVPAPPATVAILGAMDLPVFALHTVLFPGERMALRVFEERYLEMMEDVLPDGAFVVVAIREGREVGGDYEPYRVGVTVAVEDYALRRRRGAPTGCGIVGRDRVGADRADGDDALPALAGARRIPTRAAPAPTTWRPRRERSPGTWRPSATARSRAPRSPANRSPRATPIAAAAPGLLPARARRCWRCRAPGERSRRPRAILARETALVRALGAKVRRSQPGREPELDELGLGARARGAPHRCRAATGARSARTPGGSTR